MKVVVTGGHTSVALAFVEELIRRKPTVTVLWFGRKYALDKDDKPSFEYQEVYAHKIPFLNIPSRRFFRTFSLQSLLSLFRFVNGVRISIQHIKKERPDFVISFGGYIGMTVIVSCWLTGTKYFIHEQTFVPGLTNRISSWFAKKVFVGFTESALFFPVKKTQLIGNPLRREIILAIEQRKKRSKNIKPLLFITGGSIGSHSINILILPIIQDLLKTFTIIHQCGSSSEYDDFNALSKFESESYHVSRHLSSKEIAQIYTKADLILSRSGANTTTEILCLHVPSVLIPLPWSAYDEQKNQAKYLENFGLAEIYYQPEIIDKKASEILFQKILDTYKDINHYLTEAVSSAVINTHIHAAEKLVQAIISE
jgi:UDP-N-acetylglucosamine--N-acetylmuramyl-(pentapeptide) pyrophosphoryl-undecaprenol N-acetylglucosamine transferase